ncbi:hypothetical protein M0802_002358 [Mischocyttarus mexicanus]|nr:hypothetical protein M0802_002358 [Mischocyttarus mexicanus]
MLMDCAGNSGGGKRPRREERMVGFITCLPLSPDRPKGTKARRLCYVALEVGQHQRCCLLLRYFTLTL